MSKCCPDVAWWRQVYYDIDDDPPILALPLQDSGGQGNVAKNYGSLGPAANGTYVNVVHNRRYSTFNGTSSYVDIGTPAFLNAMNVLNVKKEFTVTAWVDAEANVFTLESNVMQISDLSPGYEWDFELGFLHTPNRLFTWLYDNITGQGSEAGITLAPMVVSSISSASGNYIRGYRNTVMLSNGSPLNITNWTAAIERAHLGQWKSVAGVNGYFYHGKMKNVAVWTKALNPTQIATLASL